MYGKDSVYARAGFTILELVVIVAILLFTALVGYPALQHLVDRGRLQRAVRDVGAHMQIARQEAIKFGVPVVVAPLFATGEVLVFANVDEDANLEFNPDDTKPYRSVDYEIARRPLPTEFDIDFWGPGDKDPQGADAVDGFSAAGAGPNVAVFLPDGSVQDVGALRIADARSNFFEVRVEPRATARIEIRKYHPDPPWGAAEGFFPAGRDEASGTPFWEWY